MRKQWLFALSGPLAVGAGLLFLGATSEAADHAEAPGVRSDPAADINDLYVFRSTDTGPAFDRTVFIMTVGGIGGTAFSDKIEYRFHIADSSTTPVEQTILCTADNGTPQNVTCTLGAATDTVAFDVVDDTILANGMRVFAGTRDDHFFFDSGDFTTVLNSCLGGTCDPSELVDNTGTDAFAGGDTLAIVVEVDNALFTGTSVLDVYGTTTRIP